MRASDAERERERGREHDSSVRGISPSPEVNETYLKGWVLLNFHLSKSDYGQKCNFK